MKHISLLGSTGSIGKNVLEVVKQYPGRFRVLGLAAGQNTDLLAKQAAAFDPQLISVVDEEAARKLTDILGIEWQNKIVYGPKGAERIATLPAVDMVVSAIVGAAGLTPTYAAIIAGKDIALANKETLVMAGEIIMAAVQKYKVNLLPVDSEHNAIFQALSAGRKRDVHKLILTASGGPFRELAKENFWDITKEQALCHPNWQMGQKISIDSATLMNKGLEVIEAKWLFDVKVEDIEVLIHPQSVVHSMVEFIDGSVIAQMGIPDMKIPIAYALAYPERIKLDIPTLNLTKHNINFQLPDFNKFPALKLAYQAIKHGGDRPAILNAANEVAVNAFLSDKIRFPEITLCVAETLRQTESRPITDITSILEADIAARVQAESVIEAMNINKKQKTGEQIPCPDLPPGISNKQIN
jgi:1-deoxy-D-xylulose-5-phosphate reductoisomerase